MYLKRLEVYGFKTFVQRTVFEFPPGVTAVVGPNGSGKSNVADAVRWVLGEQSFANLRSKRTDDLIFGGGHGRAPMGFAEVFLTIDNSDRLLALPYNEVTIGRRAYRNGENEYTINQARVRLRDVADAVAPLGSSYTLINQGLVDSALALQPEERRRLFEDAAEIGPYQAKKHEAERRLRETEANLIRLSDLASELEPQLRTLKRQARDAEAVGAVEAELHDLLRVWYADQWRAMTERLAAATAEEATLAHTLAAIRSDREQAAQTLQTARDDLRHQRADVEQLRTQLHVIQRDHEAATRELAVAGERESGLHRRITELEQRQRQSHAQHQTIAARIAKLSAERDQQQIVLDAEAAHLRAAETALQAALTGRHVAERAVAEQRAVVLRAAAAIETERARQHELAQRQAALTQQAVELDRALSELQQQIRDRSTDASTAQHALNAADDQISQHSAVLESLRTRRDALRRERDQWDEQITAARRQQGELHARFDALSKLARSYEGTFAGVRAAMHWAEREQRAGFALVSSLLRVPAELETAIEVALGARLQQIVVDRWADAEAAIAHLKRSGAGRATFLPLDTLKPGRRVGAPRLSGLRGIAADLIEVAPTHAVVASYLLGRTLIADDLPAARRALPELEGGWTIVTLSGEQIATGGAVTGGAATRESGTLRRERELRELPDLIEAAQTQIARQQHDRTLLTQQLDQVQAEQQQAEQHLHDAQTARNAAQRTLEQRRRDLHRAEDQATVLQRNQQQLVAEQSTLTQRSTGIADARRAAEQAHAAAEDALQGAEAVLAEQIDATGADEIELRARRAALGQRETEQRSRTAELHLQQQAAARVRDEIDATQQQLQQLADQGRALEHTLAAQREHQAQLADQLRKAETALANAQTTVRAAEQQIETLETRERDLTSQTLALEASHSRAALELQRHTSERDTLWERAAEDNLDVEQIDQIGPAESNADQSEAAPQALDQRIDQLRARLRRMGPVNALAPEEYRTAQERHAFLTTQLADVRTAAGALREAINRLDQVMQQNFATTFDAVARSFSQKFTELFGGGTARLVLQSAGSEQPAAPGGIEIVAQPPGKRQLNLQLLSGGERALTAAALLFAILEVNPSPFCILDEVDAALDEANVVRFREALLLLAEQTQFILITHNRGTVEAADTLYGITMASDGGSRILSLRLEEVADDGSLVLSG